MGNEQSGTAASVRQIPAEVYLPITGLRLNNEKVKTEIKTDDMQKQRKTHFVKTSYAGIWSLIPFSSPMAPEPRIDHFWCYWQARNCAIVGCGRGKENQYFNDIWILNLATYEWMPFETTGAVITPRSGSRATVLDDTMYVFGGEYERSFSNELFAVNLETGLCAPVPTDGACPSPRSSSVFSSFGSKLFVWGGHDGSWPSELHVLDLTTSQWSCHPQDIAGRTNAAYTTIDNIIFCFGGAKTGGLLTIDMADESLSIHPTSGPEPPTVTTNGGLVHFDDYLMFIGGAALNEYMSIHCLDLRRRRWFVFHTLPDGVTVSAVDGGISDLGLFLLPRIQSFGVSYDPTKGEIIAFLGAPAHEDRKLFVLNIREALSYLHLMTDMLISCSLTD